MFVGWTGLYAGVSLLIGIVWPLGLLPVVAIAVHRQIRREERALERRFGDAYRAYARDVPAICEPSRPAQSAAATPSPSTRR